MSGFNLSKEKVPVNQTQKTEMTIEDALKSFNIERIDLPLKNGSLQEIRNGFVGSVDVKFANGVYISLSLMKSRFENSAAKWHMPNATASVILQDADVSTHAAVGNTVEGASRDDGTKRSYASAFMPKDMLGFIRRYVNLAAEKVQFVAKTPATDVAKGDKEGESAVI